MFVIGVTRATGKLLVTSLFKGVGTLRQGEREIPSVERNNGICHTGEILVNELSGVASSSHILKIKGVL
jgi:hypothetical protein